MEEEKMGKIIVDGAIVDIDKLSADELEAVVNKLKEEESALEDKIDSILER